MKVLHNGLALFIKDETINAQVLDLYRNVKVIGCPMTGLDHIDLEECKRRGVKVISLGLSDTRDWQTRRIMDEISSTAEHTIGLMVALLRNYKTALNGPYGPREQYIGHTLKGKKLLLIGGLGRVGRQVSAIAEAVGMDVYVWDNRIGDNRIVKWVTKMLRLPQDDYYRDLLYGISQADIVSIHIPAAENTGFFDTQLFLRMKRSAYLINTSRSSVIQKGTLRWALDSRVIAGAAVDFADEPELIEYAAQNSNLILTNHIGGMTYEDRAATDNFIIKKINNYLEGEGNNVRD